MNHIWARFVPIVRTFAPFLAGVGAMTYRKFLTYNVIGAAAWVGSLAYAGYLFGNIPLIKHNFGLVTLLIIVASLLPMVVAFFRRSRAPEIGDLR